MMDRDIFESVKNGLPRDLRADIEYQADKNFESNLNLLLEHVLIHSFSTLEGYLILLDNDDVFWEKIQTTILQCKNVYEKYHNQSTKFRGYQLFRAIELTSAKIGWDRCVRAIRFLEFEKIDVPALTISRQLTVINQINDQRNLIAKRLKHDRNQHDIESDEMLEAKYKQLTSWITLMQPQGNIELK